MRHGDSLPLVAALGKGHKVHIESQVLREHVAVATNHSGNISDYGNCSMTLLFWLALEIIHMYK